MVCVDVAIDTGTLIALSANTYMDVFLIQCWRAKTAGEEQQGLFIPYCPEEKEKRMTQIKRKILMIGLIVGFCLSGTTAGAFSFNFNGKMWQTIGATDNAGALQSQFKSSKTNYFGYADNIGHHYLNIHGATNEGYYKFMDNDISTTFGLTKARLRFEGMTDDGRAKFVYGLEFGSINWGDQSKGMGLSGDGINQETRLVYADIQIPGLNENHIIRAGLQGTKINHWLWTETAAGLTYHGKSGGSSWMVGWYRGDEDRAGDSSDNDYFVLKSDHQITEKLTIGFFGVYADAGDESTTALDDYAAWTTGPSATYDDDTYYIGLTGKGKMGPLFGNFDLIYQGGDIEFEDPAYQDLDHNAWLGNLTVGYKFSDKFKMYANVLYVSGDDDPTDDDVENFNSIDVDVKVGIIFTKDSLLGDCDRFVTDSPYLLDRGLINYSLTGEYQFSPEHHFRGAVRYLQTAEDLDGYGTGGDDELGTEVDFWYAYRYNKYVTLRAEAAYLFAGNGADQFTDTIDDDADDLYTVAAGIMFQF